MQMRKLGKTGLDVSVIGLGGAAIAGEGGGYGFGEISFEKARDILLYAYEKGINLFDSAPVYGFSLSEKRIGAVLKSVREKVIYTSKSGVSWHDTKRINMTNDVKTTRLMLEQSLKDLQSDYIDLYMIHWPDEKIDIRYPVEVLAQAKLEGKIKHIGLCNTTQEDFHKAQEVALIEFFQAEHNAFEHGFYERFENELEDLGFMGWGSFDKGILTGRVSLERKYEKSDARSWAPWWKAQDLKKKLETVEKIKILCDEYQLELLDFCLHFNLSFKNLSTLLCGVKKSDDLDLILLSLKKKIPSEFLERAKKLL